VSKKDLFFSLRRQDREEITDSNCLVVLRYGQFVAYARRGEFEYISADESAAPTTLFAESANCHLLSVLGVLASV
jgi:hypothetical protein